MMEWMHSWMVLLTHCNDSLKTEYNSGYILSSVPRDLKCPQQTLQKHVLKIQNHLIQDSSSSAWVPYMYVYIFFNSFGAILHLHCTDFYQTYILFLTEVVVEKSSHCIVFFFLLQFFHMHQCTNMSINKLLLHIKSFMQDVFFLCLYCLTKCIVEYLTVHSWQVLHATNTFNSGIFNIFLLHYTWWQILPV